MDTLVIDLPSVEEAAYAKAYGERVGRGAYREVYRLPGSSWAYKFERTDTWHGTNGANRVEFNNFSNRRNTLPDGVDFPEMEMLSNGAIAVEYVEGVLARDTHSWEYGARGYVEECMCSSHRSSLCWQQAVERIDMKDLHGGNVMIRKRDGMVLIIDIGEYGDEN